MSALWQLLASLWAAVWLRSRLVAAKARRLFGGSAATAGAGYYLAAAEIPVEGVDYELVDLPPELAARLDAARVELVDQARGAATHGSRHGGARRRRTASLVTAALVTLALLGAGATALIAGSTGVPAIDRLLGVEQSQLDSIDAPRPDVAPRAGDASDPLVVPWGEDGSREAVGVAYVGRGDDICLSLAAQLPDGGQRLVGGGGCTPADSVWERLDTGDAFVASTAFGAPTSITGLASEDVESIGVAGPNGPLTVELGRSWVPDLDGAMPVRMFVAVARPGSEPADPTPAEAAAISDPRNYRLVARLRDGRSIEIPALGAR